MIIIRKSSIFYVYCCVLNLSAAIDITSLPITIDKSDQYAIRSNLTYSGSGAAITIKADNVSILFTNHKVTLSNDAAQGIVANNVSGLTIQNGTIECSTSSTNTNSKAILFTGVTSSIINNMSLNNTAWGVNIDIASSDIEIKNSIFQNNQNADFANTIRASNLTLNNCSFNNCNTLAISRDDQPAEMVNCEVKNCQFIETVMQISGVKSFSLSNCRYFSTTVNLPLVALIGANSADRPLINGTMQNCDITQGNTDAESAILVARANNINIQGVRLTSDSSSSSSSFASGLLIAGAVSNLTVSNCIIKNKSKVALCVENKEFESGVNSNLIIQDCLFDSSNVGILFDSTTSSVIQNCQILNNTTNGIQLTGTDSITIKNNIVNLNGGDGIVLDSTTTNNTVQSNNVSKNTGTGINNDPAATTNKFLDNISQNNTVADYANVPNTGAPGSSPTLGQNITS